MRILRIFADKWPNWVLLLPILLFFRAGRSTWLPIFFAVFGCCLLLFLVEKMIAELHFGTKKWPRSLWVLLAVGSSPQFFSVFWAVENGVLRALTFACAAIYFLIKFLEDADAVFCAFATLVLGAQILLILPVFGMEWLLFGVSAWHYFQQKKGVETWIFLAALLVLLAVYLSENKVEWLLDFSRFWVFLFLFWPVFGLFMPIYVFFLKKTDCNSFPKIWILWSVFASVFSAFLFPNLEKMELAMAWIGVVLLTFPVFERGILYGVFVLKKWKIWAIVGLFFGLNWLVFWLKN